MAIPKYHFRISYIFIDASYLFVMIALFQFTDPLKTSIMKKLNRQPNIIGEGIRMRKVCFIKDL
jgi:hypothetical protein